MAVCTGEFPKNKWDPIVTMDDDKRRIHSSFFVAQEDAQNGMTGVREVLRNIPML